ncbi:hypothetical protein KCP71_07110 [Salmonella enterica subsp. enterica]|nr:hypothetical protein KCP71_07110 [Salmonella enterica subsp. enterica]
MQRWFRNANRRVRRRNNRKRNCCASEEKSAALDMLESYLSDGTLKRIRSIWRYSDCLCGRYPQLPPGRARLWVKPPTGQTGRNAFQRESFCPHRSAKGQRALCALSKLTLQSPYVDIPLAGETFNRAFS